MRNWTVLSARRGSLVARSMVVVGLSLALASCAGGMESVTGIFGGGSQSSQVQRTSAPGQTIGGVSVEQLRADQLCPSIVTRDGTETLRIYGGEEETAATVRYQSQILETVVECTPGVGQFGLSIGVAGRSLIGPLGTPATLDLPIRVAVLNTVTGEVMASEVRRTQAAIVPPEVSANFSLVDRSFVVPAPTRQTDYQVIVGFDSEES